MARCTRCEGSGFVAPVRLSGQETMSGGLPDVLRWHSDGGATVLVPTELDDPEAHNCNRCDGEGRY